MIRTINPIGLIETEESNLKLMHSSAGTNVHGSPVQVGEIIDMNTDVNR